MAETEGSIHSWCAEGIVLKAEDKEVSTAQLLKFAQEAHARYPLARVRIAEFALRVMEWTDNGGVAPYLDWRD